MELQHSFTVPTSVDEAWDLFMDLSRVGGCFPGATVTDFTGEGFAGTVKVKLGPIALLYAGSGSFLERDEDARRAVVEAKGKDKRGNGTASATVTIQLTQDGQSTRADVQTDLAITGKPAQFGRGVMQDVSDKLLGQFIACIEQQLAGEGAAGVAEAGTGPGITAPAAEPVSEAAAPGSGAAAPERVGRPTELLGDTEVDEGAISVTEQRGGSGAPTGPAGGAAGPGASVPTRPSPAAYQPPEDNAIDLGATVLPVLARRYAGLAIAGAIGLVLGWLLGRRRRR